MFREKLLYALACVVMVVAVFHVLAVAFSLYWMFWWYDILLHFLGGVFIALFVIWTGFFSGYLGNRPLPSLSRLFLITLLWVLTIGVGWEIFERLLGHTWSIEGYWLDTISDLVFDLFGGILGFAAFSHYYAQQRGT